MRREAATALSPQIQQPPGAKTRSPLDPGPLLALDHLSAFCVPSPRLRKDLGKGSSPRTFGRVGPEVAAGPASWSGRRKDEAGTGFPRVTSALTPDPERAGLAEASSRSGLSNHGWSLWKAPQWLQQVEEGRGDPSL